MELLARDQLLLVVPVGQVNLDRVSAALEPASRRVLVVTHHGEQGGASLQVLEGGRSRLLLSTAVEDSLSAPVWGEGGQSFALVLQRPARLDPATRRLQHPGELWLGDAAGKLHRAAPAVADAARVLGWVGDLLLFTRHAGGDLPEEALAALDTRRGEIRELLRPGPAGHHYGFTLLGDDVGLVRSEQPVGSGPSAGQVLEVALLDTGGSLRIVAREQGAMPIELALEEDRLAYRLEGRRERVSIDLRSGTRAVELTRPSFTPPDRPAANATLAGLSMPYIHQVYDTPNDFNGNWACAPTSTVMAIQHFGRLKPWPITIDVPTPHNNDYGAYVAYKYSAYGTTFDRMQTDASGKPAYGAYGWCTDGGGGWAWRMQDYAVKHDLKSDFSGSTTFAQIKAAIDDGKVVVQSTQLTSAGHLITIKGYTSDGKLIVNDPYGNKTLGTYPNYKGGDTVYGFSYIVPKWHITVYGTPTKVEPEYAAAPGEKSFPAAMVAGATAEASLSFKNVGTATWGSNTRLGTTMPRDRESPFYSAGWLSKTRVAAAGAVKPGSTATFSFSLTAPAVTEEKVFQECFNLVEENKAWFSASGQGGPKDDAVCLSITVRPAPATAGGDAGELTLETLRQTPATETEVPRVRGARPEGCALVAASSPGPPWLLLLLLLVACPTLLSGRWR